MMYRLTLLGGVSLHGPSGPLGSRVVQGHHLALLALLVRRPDTPLARAKAAGLLWGGRPEAKARARLSDTVYRIRQELGDGAILSVADGLLLNADVLQGDVTAFDEAVADRRWREAVNLYGGPFLDGFHLDGAADFERWLDRERRRLSVNHHRALQALAEAAEEAGEWSEAAAWWHEGLARQPTNTGVALRLMKALAAAGNLAGALEQARTHERRLRAELDLPLPREVRELAEGLVEEAG